MRGGDPIEKALYRFLVKSVMMSQALERARDSLRGIGHALEALQHVIDALPRFGAGELPIGKAKASIREIEELGREVQAAWEEAELEVRVQRIREALEYVTRGSRGEG